MQRRTRIVVTLGPACASAEGVRELIRSGADVFRINSSHTDAETLATYVRLVREAADRCSTHVGILLDLQGPRIRLAAFRNGSVVLTQGASLRITSEEVCGSEEQVSTTYKDFAKDVRPGDRVLLADGTLELVVTATNGTAADCRVVRGGAVSDHQGINLPGTSLSAPSLTAKDLEDLQEGIRQGVDMVALSFVRGADDVVCLRELVEQEAASAAVIAKIERPEAWQRIDDILQVCDGVMIARGDLGVEVAMGHVPHIQKIVIEKARRQNRFVITATHMLESMIENAVPTRAEVSDIANAVYDGTDALMLSGETARGKHPIDAVRVMSEIACAAELHSPADHPLMLETAGRDDAEIIADAACRASAVEQMKAIAVFTVTGHTAHLIAARRPAVPIFAFTSTPAIARQLSVWYGVTALVAPPLGSHEEMANYMDRELLQCGQVEPGDHVLFVAGDPVGVPGSTNVLKVHAVLGVVTTANP